MTVSMQQPPLVLRLKRSRIGRGALLLVFFLALIAVGLAELPPYGRLGAALLAVALTWRAWRAPQPLELKLHADGRLEWRDAAASWQTATVLAHSSVNPWLCLLAYRTPGERRARHVLILPDSLKAVDFRRLRVWLRWQARVEGDDRKAQTMRR